MLIPARGLPQEDLTNLRKSQRNFEEAAERAQREVQRSARSEYNEKRDFGDPLKGIRGFLVVRAFENDIKINQTTATRTEKSRKDVG